LINQKDYEHFNNVQHFNNILIKERLENGRLGVLRQGLFSKRALRLPPDNTIRVQAVKTLRNLQVKRQKEKAKMKEPEANLLFSVFI
jgi:hypothetical protein